MWNSKNKALTFSFDDGVTQDIRAIEILDKYNLKATFNLNSSLLGMTNQLNLKNGPVRHDKVLPSDVRDIYKNHEVAVHTLTHPNLTNHPNEVVTWQVEQDRLALEFLTGKPVIGMAYPCGGVNNDNRVANVIKETTGVFYCRTITSSESFEPQSNLYRFNPTVYYVNVERMFDLGRQFIDLKTDSPAIYYIWGHTYEMDDGIISWEKFEEFCALMSNKNDIFYGTNREVLLRK